MKKTQIRQNNLPQVPLGKSFCTGHILRMHNDQNLGADPFNLCCIQSTLPESLHTSQTEGPHLQKQVSKLRIDFTAIKSKCGGLCFL